MLDTEGQFVGARGQEYENRVEGRSTELREIGSGQNQHGERGVSERSVISTAMASDVQIPQRQRTVIE